LKTTFYIGTRGSPLALKQAEWVTTQLKNKYPQFNFNLIKIKTRGDKIYDVPLAKLGGKGLFVKEIEEALIEKKIDLAVHSLKDVPINFPEELTLGAIPPRENPLDVLISRNGNQLEHLPRNARIGTSSLRRQAQLRKIRNDFRIDSLRGNIDTRLKKLEIEQLDAIIIAAAGIIRLGKKEKITQYLNPEQILPAVGQGALGIQTRRDDPEINSLISFLHHPETAQAILAERAFLKRLEGGCQVPIAALAKIIDGKLLLDGLISSVDGEKIIRDKIEGNPQQAEDLGSLLAEKLLAAGGKTILEEIYSENKS